MLSNVHIKNLALIDDVNISFTEGLNIITGETGAGKSIVIGSLKLGMGERMTRNLLRDDSKEGLCQLLFQIDDEATVSELKKLGIFHLEDGELLISRRLNGTRTTNTINDEIATATKLREVSALLVDMHSQHEQQTLLHKSRHLEILDRFGDESVADLKDEMATAYRAYDDVRSELEASTMDEAERNRKVDFLRYEISEIEAAALTPGEDTELEVLYKRMENSRKIIEEASGVYEITGYEGGTSAGNEIGRALSRLKEIRELDPALDELHMMLTDIDSLINDFDVSLKDYMVGMEFEEAQFKEVSDRLNVINILKGKYGRTIEDILAYLAEGKAEYNKLIEHDAYIDELERKLAAAKERMLDVAGRLSAERKRQSVELCKQIREALSDLSFSDVIFEMNFDELPSCTSNGIDDCYFNISTNVGEAPRPLYEVASGGELSRIMLAIKSCMAGRDNVDTLIFDEIDVGISGRAAQSVSKKMSKIARDHQVISITHLPQIAAMADSHYLIKKSVQEDRTVTDVTALDRDGSIEEIARLLGGERITDAVRCNAVELKELADKAKIDHN